MQQQQPCLIFLERCIFIKPQKWMVNFTFSLQLHNRKHFSLSSPFEMKVCIRQGVNVLAFTGPVLGWLVIKSVCCCFNMFIFCPRLSELCFFFSLFLVFKRASDISSARCFIQHRHTLSAFSQIAMYYIQNNTQTIQNISLRNTRMHTKTIAFLHWLR